MGRNNTKTASNKPAGIAGLAQDHFARTYVLRIICASRRLNADETNIPPREAKLPDGSFVVFRDGQAAIDMQQVKIRVLLLFDSMPF